MVLLFFPPGLCSQDDVHCDTRPSDKHSGGLLETDMGERVRSHCHANPARGEGKGMYNNIGIPEHSNTLSLLESRVLK